MFASELYVISRSLNIELAKYGRVILVRGANTAKFRISVLAHKRFPMF